MEWVGIALLIFLVLGIGATIGGRRRDLRKRAENGGGGWVPWVWFGDGGTAHGGSDSGPGSDPGPDPSPSPSPDVGDFSSGGDFGGFDGGGDAG